MAGRASRAGWRGRLLAAVAATGLLGACSSGGGSATTTTAPASSAAPTTASTTTPTSSTTAPATTAPASTIPVPVPANGVVFFVQDDRLSPVGRELPAEPAEALRRSLDELVRGPTTFEHGFAGLDTMLPDDARVLGSRLEATGATRSRVETTAVVDVDAAFAAEGGSRSGPLRVAQVVLTATLATNATKVRITVAGATARTVAGVEQPAEGFDRRAFDAYVPQIVLLAPAPGATLRSPTVVRGLANTFEGNVLVELVDGEGVVLARGQGTGMMGDWGPFEITLSFGRAATSYAVLRAWEASAEDGRRIHVVTVPLRLG